MDTGFMNNFKAGKEHRAYEHLGCLPAGDGLWDFAVWAPGAKSVSVVGDFNGWQAECGIMKSSGGFWTRGKVRARRGDNYKYAVTGADGITRLKADPFALYCETGPATASRIWDLRDTEWTDSEYLSRRSKLSFDASPIVIYELHPGSWMDGQTDYRTLGDRLADYCAYMGFTHIELMPITEYPYGGSWGYQVTGYFAPTSRFGTPQELAYMVDRLHSRGIGVILDWVPAHFSADAHGLSRFDGTALFERPDEAMARHPQWGTLIFDYAKPEVRSFLVSSAMSFFDRFHIDGLRVDAVASALFLDYGRQGGFLPNRDGGCECYEAAELMRELNSAVRSTFPGCFTIAEEPRGFPGATHADGLGFTGKWDLGFTRDTLDYLSLDPSQRRASSGKLTFSMTYYFSESHILALSHDEVSPGKCALPLKLSAAPEERFPLLRAFWGYFFAHPGKKLLFMGTEFAQATEWDHNGLLQWELLAVREHRDMLEYIRTLCRLYSSHDALFSIDRSWDGFSWLNTGEDGSGSFAFMRTGLSGEVLVCAFCFVPEEVRMTICMPRRGRLVPLLSSGTAAPAVSCTGQEHAVQLFLGPLSCVYYTFIHSEEEDE